METSMTNEPVLFGHDINQGIPRLEDMPLLEEFVAQHNSYKASWKKS